MRERTQYSHLHNNGAPATTGRAANQVETEMVKRARTMTYNKNNTACQLMVLIMFALNFVMVSKSINKYGYNLKV